MDNGQHIRTIILVHTFMKCLRVTQLQGNGNSGGVNKNSLLPAYIGQIDIISTTSLP